MNERLLAIYLNDHRAGAALVRAGARRSLSSNEGTDLGNFLAGFLVEVEEDGETLDRVMDAVGARKDPFKLAAATLAEKLGRFKLNGQLTGYSPLSRLEELEGLSLGVEGKLALWRTLKKVAASDPRLAFGWDELIERARKQRAGLERFRLQAAVDALG